MFLFYVKTFREFVGIALSTLIFVQIPKTILIADIILSTSLIFWWSIK